MMDSFLKNINSSWTLFLDRDGVINKRLVDNYIKSWDEFEFLPGVLESMAVFSKLFGKIIVVTNQQGVGKGWMTETELKGINKKMTMDIKDAGGRIDAVYYCTDLKNKYGNCRKPSTVLFERARRDFPEIDPSKSIMAGDSQSDIDFGTNAGMYTVFIGSENSKANGCFDSLLGFAKIISQ